jgi:hypothetical protein
VTWPELKNVVDHLDDDQLKHEVCGYEDGKFVFWANKIIFDKEIPVLSGTVDVDHPELGEWKERE